MILSRVISGGQTGVDRAGLDAAAEAGIPIGGCCPKGRKAEDGVIPACYPLEELQASEYSTRTERNVIDSDGTLILNKGALTEGTKATYDFTLHHHKPSLIVQLDADPVADPQHVVNWITEKHISVLNVAGPRESKFPEGIYKQAHDFLLQLFLCLR